MILLYICILPIYQKKWHHHSHDPHDCHGEALRHQAESLEPLLVEEDCYKDGLKDSGFDAVATPDIHELSMTSSWLINDLYAERIIFQLWAKLTPMTRGC